MTISEKNQVLSSLENLKKLNFDELIAKQIGNGNIETEKIAEMPAYLVLTYITDTISILEKLDVNNCWLVPFYLDIQGNKDTLVGALNFIYSRSNSLSNIVVYVNNVKSFVSIYGHLIEGSEKKAIDKNIIRQELDKIKIRDAQQKELSEKLSKLIDLAEKSKTNLDEFQNIKKQELQEISNSLGTIRNNLNESNSLLVTTNNVNQNINTILNNINNTVKNTDKAIEKSKTDFEKLIGELNEVKSRGNEFVNEFESKNGVFGESLKFVEEKRTFFEERNQYLQELIGREVGASLFETFKQRKKELEKGIRLWYRTSIVSGIVASIVIIAIFTNAFGLMGGWPTNYSWELIAINALKSLPFIYFFYFAITQYGKERNFQEEYAFKSAAALTVKAYAEQISDKAKKDEHIIEAVRGIYKSPIPVKQRFNKEPQGLVETIIQETLKQVKNNLPGGNKI